MVKDQVQEFTDTGAKIPLVTLRWCLEYLQKDFQEILATEKEVSNEKYAELLKEFLSGDL